MLKTQRLVVKILETDKSALELMARTEGESLAVITRRIIRNEIVRRGLLPTNINPALAPEKSELTGEPAL